MENPLMRQSSTTTAPDMWKRRKWQWQRQSGRGEWRSAQLAAWIAVMELAKTEKGGEMRWGEVRWGEAVKVGMDWAWHQPSGSCFSLMFLFHASQEQHGGGEKLSPVSFNGLAGLQMHVWGGVAMNKTRVEVSESDGSRSTDFYGSICWP